MFGTNSFGQSSSSPSGSQPVFEQNNVNSNPFAPQPFGSTNPFNSQTGGSIIGGTSTGVCGSQFSSPLGSTSVFGASSSPAFGRSIPTFGASSGSAFGNSSSASSESGSSVFGQISSFGGFGSTDTHTSPFGSSFQQSQPQSHLAFGSNMFDSSTPFGAPSQPALDFSFSPAFGAQTSSAFGGCTPAFGSSTANPTFGSTTGGFGVPGASTPTFGASTSSAFGTPSMPAFGATSSPAFGATAAPAFGAPSAPSFNFGSRPTFGLSTSTFGNTPFGTSSFGAQTSLFGAQTTSPAFGGQRGGSTVSPYSPTHEVEAATNTQPAGKLESISAMPVYKDKSHEEFRWEDYQLGDKGGQRRGSRVSPYSPTPEADGAIISTQPARRLESSSTMPLLHGATSALPAGSRVSPYSPTPEADGTPSALPDGKLRSISTMPVYNDKSHEELRWEDYQLGDKGGQRRGSRVSPYSPTPEADGTPSALPDGKLRSISAMSVYKDKSHEVLRWEDYQLGDKGQRRGSRVSPYSPTPEAGGTTSSTQPAGKLESISAMPVYEYKSHEELRQEDYQLGDKGGSAPANQASSFGVFGNTGFPSSPTPAFVQTPSNLFSSSMSSNPFATTTPVFSSPGFGTTSTSPAFGSSPSTPSLFRNTSTSPAFGSSPSTPSLFRNTSTSPVFGSSPFGTSNTLNPFVPTLSAAPSSFRNRTRASRVNSRRVSTSAFGSSLGFGSTQSSPLFQTSTPTLIQASAPFGQTPSPFGQSAPRFGQSNISSTPSTSFGNILSTTSSLPNSNSALVLGQTTSSLSAQPSTSFGGFNIGRSESANTSDTSDTPGQSSITLIILQFLTVLYRPQH